MPDEIPKLYEPAKYETAIYERWLAADAFAAVPDGRRDRYVIMMPLPNVTGALHMGHAMDNVMQDLLIRWRRMTGDNTLWMPGTDHAGIGTQAVVEKRLFELEGKTRHDLGREGLVARIRAWKDEYRERIIRQQQSMGCSCDWKRQRFTMDDVCARAVREAFFRLFRDGLIYRGNRMVNWDCQLQTAVSDDEIVYEKVKGHFWHIRYPLADAAPGEPPFLTVATTRPETMLGDTAVAVHPDPAGELERRIAALREKREAASRKEREEIDAELERLDARKAEVLPHLLALRAMAERGRTVLLPLVDRLIPLILDPWADPALGTGCVKITPAHDPNDYDVWSRHKDRIGILNILNPDGTLNAAAGPYAGIDRFAARKRVVADLKAAGLLAEVEDREIEIGHSDRSKTPIEPYISKQWFVRMGDVPGGIVCGAGTPHEFPAAGLAQVAIDAAGDNFLSPTGRHLTFHPDHARYGGTYASWLSEKRDWCISRQLWWGHRIPIWQAGFAAAELAGAAVRLPKAGEDELCAWIADAALAEYWLSYAHYQQENTAEAKAILLSTLANVRAGLKVEPDFTLRLLMAISSNESREGNHAAALAYLEEVRGLAGDLDDRRRAAYLYDLAHSYRETGDYEGALRAGIASLELYRHAEADRETATLENDLALSYLAVGNTTKADELANSSRRTFESLADDRALAHVIETQARIGLILGSFEQAVAQATAALELAEGTGNPNAIVQALLTRARARTGLGDMAGALADNEQAGQVARESSTPTLLRQALGQWADALALSGDHERAFTLMREALATH